MKYPISLPTFHAPIALPVVLPIILALLAGSALNNVEAQELQILRPNEDPLPVPIAPGSSVQIAPGTGNLTLTTTEEFSCQQGNGACEISITGLDGFFRINGATGTVDAVMSSTISMTWRARGAWSCTGTGDLVGTGWNTPGKLPEGSQNVNLGTLVPGTYSVGLRCENGPTTVDATNITLEITESDITVPPGCEGRQPPGNFVTGSQCIFNSSTVDCSSYDSVFGPFPGVISGVQFTQPNGTFTAFEFSTANLTATGGSWQFVPPQFGNQNTGPRLVSISNCPGDFDQAKIEAELGPGCYQKSRPPLLGGDLDWFRAGTSGSGCQLEVRAQPYFLNIIFTQDPEGTPPSQITWQCGDSTDTSACLSNLAPEID